MKVETERKTYTLKEREEQVQDLISANARLNDEKYMLEMKLDALQEHQDGKTEDLRKDNDSLRNEVEALREELGKMKMGKTSIGLSETALKQINEELARENEELKLSIRKLKEELSIENKELKIPIKINIDRELNEKNCELSIVNSCLANKVRDADWAMMQVETHLQMISSILNHTREEIVV